MSASGIEVSLAPDLAAVAGLRAEWLALWSRSLATPFQSPGCLLAWAGRHAPDRLAAVSVREGGRLVGLLPLFDWQGDLLLAGTGPTDYNGGVFEPGRSEVASAALAAAAELARARHCRRIDLHQLRPESLLLTAAAPEGWRSVVGKGDICPASPVLGEDGLGAMPAKWVRKLAYSRRKIAAAGGYTVELATSATVSALTEALLDLHGRRWRTLGEPGVLEEPLMRGFVQDAAPAWLAEGLLRLWALRIGGEVSAVLWVVQDARAAHMYLTGFDPARVALGPGSLLIAHAIAAAAAEGAREIRFLRGEEPYKAHWGAVPAPTWRRTLMRG